MQTRGDGINLATTLNNPPPARLLDVTRLVRRAGRVLTGVDRVEMAYLEALTSDPVPVFGLARTPLGYILLDQDGLTRLRDALLESSLMVSPDLYAKLTRGLSAVEQRAQATLRKLALARAVPWRLPAMLARHLPHGSDYFNVGHSNLTPRVLRAVKVMGGTSAVMVHDVIPLDYPQYQKPGTIEGFAAKLRCVGEHVDVVIYNSADTQAQAERHLQAWGSAPRSIVSHLGTDLTAPDPTFECPTGPYFVSLGTIEPRKNHALLLDVWDELGPNAPQLHIVGGRGWNNDAVFARLDALPADGPVQERTGLSDAQVAALLAGSRGLLFPSHCEGFGLPPIEAAALGVPVVVNDLAVLRETLGDIPIYASVSDRYLWEKAVKDLADGDDPQRLAKAYTPRDWATHFNEVLRLI